AALRDFLSGCRLLSGYPFPYPEFAQVIYAADAKAYTVDALCPNEVDGLAGFIAFAEVRRLPMARAWSAFLELAAEER
ncbi:MAG: hypothetical protein ACRDJE_29425, partial [Dehalococcoidia bacterium]